MKKLFSLCLLILFLYESRGQDIIKVIKYEEIKNKHEERFSELKNQILVEFSNEAEAKNKKSNVILTSNLQDIGSKEGQITPSLTNNRMVFDLKDKLVGESDITFAFIDKGKKVGEIKLTKEKPSGGVGNPSEEIKYRPKPPPPGFDILVGFSDPSQSVDLSGYKKLYTGNSLVYSFCGEDQNIYHKKEVGAGEKNKFRPKVGTPLSIQLNPVPNPLRYDITIKSKYNNYGMDADPLLEALLLDPGKFLAKTQRGGGEEKDISIEEKNRKEEILGYLYKINAQINQFYDKYEKADCINSGNFNDNKKKIEENINTKLASVTDLNYLGNYIDFIKMEFDISDSSYVLPLVRNYLKFKNFHVSPFFYQIPRLKNADELSVNLKIVPKEKSNASMKVDDMDIDLPVFGGFKIDVSPGLFYSFNNNNKYSLRNDSTSVISSTGADSVTSRFRSIVKESGVKNNIGFSSLLHFYSRWGEFLNIAASLGAGLTLDEKPEIKYLTGVSLLFGRVNRLAFTAGRSFGKVDEISDRYFEGDNRGNAFRKVNMKETTLQTKKVLKDDWFISVSYNIPLIRRKAKTKESESTASEKTQGNNNSGQSTTTPENKQKNKGKGNDSSETPET